MCRKQPVSIAVITPGACYNEFPSVSLCLEEIERLNKTQLPNQPLQSEPANFITALECLLESRGQGNLNILEELKISGKVEAALDEVSEKKKKKYSLCNIN